MQQYVGMSTQKPTKRMGKVGTTRRSPVRATPAFRGLARSRDLETQGKSRATLRRMVAQGALQQFARGLYAPAEFHPTEHHGLAVVAARVPQGVVCLLSALQFHRLGTQAPFEVWLAIHRKARKPTFSETPVRIVRFSEIALESGVEDHDIEGVRVRVTSAARTVVDCFKYRNKIGIDVALEAMREYRRSRRPVDDLTRAARVVRIEKVMRPYLEAVVS
jgi:predicted transcriptional regulator of viral defense system